MKPVQHVSPGSATVHELMQQFEHAGVMGAGKLGKAVSILHHMISRNSCTVFMGVAGAMIPGGMHKILMQFLEQKWIHILVTTGATLTHDLVEGFGYPHIQGSESADDAALYKQGYDRMFDSYMNNKVYGKLENFFAEHYNLLHTASSIQEFTQRVGKVAPSQTMLHIAWKQGIPIFCPAIADSGIGLMIWGKLAKGDRYNVPAFTDLKDIMDHAWTSKEIGVFYIGGGTPKNFIQQALQLAPNKAQYGVQITMDRPEPGGSSGAPLKEGISWGKLHAAASFVDVICDATIALPLISAALAERLNS